MEQRRFLVTGCGRSGTGYASKLLTELGAPCGHEILFEVERLEEGAAPEWPDEVWGESSWLAAPFLEALAPGTIVLHQVRHPLAVVRSFARQSFFGRRHPWRAFAYRHCAELADHSPIDACFAYWLRWNQMAARAAALPGLRYMRYRVEDMDSDLLRRIADEIGLEVSDPRLEAELATLSRSTNTAGDKSRDRRIGWGDLSDPTTLGEVLDLAASYGYAAAATVR